MSKTHFTSRPSHARAGDTAVASFSLRTIASATLRAFAAPVVAAACLLASSDPGFSQTIDENLWAANGTVYTVVRDGGTIYIGGNFTHVGPATGGGVPLDAASGALPPSFPKVVGTVESVISDGAGGWYIGGIFSAVGGIARSNLAHVASDLSVSAWDPSPDNQVRALAMSGSTVYAGGIFTVIGGQERYNIAALDATSGAATSWDPFANGTVSGLAVSGSTVYACGYFTNIGGLNRRGIGALDATTGAATAWNPNANSNVLALAVSGSTVYAGGSFSLIGGQARNSIAALDAATGTATAWDPNPNGIVLALAVSGSTVYAGGSFSLIGGQARNSIAALDATTGAASAWNPNTNGIVQALALSGSSVYAGGSFSLMGGQERRNVAALDATTGAATAWNPSPIGAAGYITTVYALAASGSTVYAGGDFIIVGAQARNNIAALDATTGAATAWNPTADGPVNALAVSGPIVYAAGDFSGIGGRARIGIAVLDATTGAAAAWNATASGSVSALAVSGSTVYAGGSFTSIGGQTRNRIAALDATTAAATAWDPNASSPVHALLVSGSSVYVGGEFTSIGGQARNRIAALDAATGAASTWNPNASGGLSPAVHALAASGSRVYAGGFFSNIGGQARSNIAALDATTGAATAWNPIADNQVRALLVSGSSVYAGGDFNNIGGLARNNIAALDATTGAATSVWNPNANFAVYALASSGSTLYAGGRFTTIGALPRGSIAGMGDVTTPTLLSLVSARAVPDRVELTWYAPARDVSSATAYRRTVRDDWETMSQIWADGTGRLFFQDTQVIAGTRYGYRLGVMEGGQETFLGETWVEVPVAPGLALAGPRSNPAREHFSVAFSLPDASPARLELLDMAGRRIAAREVGTLGAGNHVVAFGEGRALAPGVYVLRLSQGPRSLTARGVIVR